MGGGGQAAVSKKFTKTVYLLGAPIVGSVYDSGVKFKDKLRG
jgi:hypothetical protein